MCISLSSLYKSISFDLPSIKMCPLDFAPFSLPSLYKSKRRKQEREIFLKNSYSFHCLHTFFYFWLKRRRRLTEVLLNPPLLLIYFKSFQIQSIWCSNVQSKEGRLFKSRLKDCQAPIDAPRKGVNQKVLTWIALAKLTSQETNFYLKKNLQIYRN